MTICVLKNLRKGEALKLPDIVISEPGKKIIGRSAETQIESSSVSREHCKLRKKILRCKIDFFIFIAPLTIFSGREAEIWWQDNFDPIHWKESSR